MDDSECFFYLDDRRPTLFGNLASVAHNDIAIANRVHLVDTDLFTQLIKLAKESGKQIDHLLWLVFRLFWILGELSEAYHVGVKERDIVKRVDDSLVILDAGEDMERDELAEQILRLFDLHLHDSLLVNIGALIKLRLEFKRLLGLIKGELR